MGPRRALAFLGLGIAVVTGTASGQPAPMSPPSGAERPAPYASSWALVIGINAYERASRLNYAVADARAVAAHLPDLGFPRENTRLLLDGAATRREIERVLYRDFARMGPGDRLLVYFAGHGHTQEVKGGDEGFIMPVEAEPDALSATAISMDDVRRIGRRLPAKHVLFIMDSCYSGLAITRGQAVNNYIREVARRTARQMLTAGGANEEVADNGPNGHSVFTWTVLQGLEGRADLNSDGFISAAELAAYVGPSVSGLSHQTPAFGNLPGSEGGEFIFELHPETEFLSDLSTQLDQEAIQINTELDRIRKEIAKIRVGNGAVGVNLDRLFIPGNCVIELFHLVIDVPDIIGGQGAR